MYYLDLLHFLELIDIMVACCMCHMGVRYVPHIVLYLHSR